MFLPPGPTIMVLSKYLIHMAENVAINVRSTDDIITSSTSLGHRPCFKICSNSNPYSSEVLCLSVAILSHKVICLLHTPPTHGYYYLLLVTFITSILLYYLNCSYYISNYYGAYYISGMPLVIQFQI